MERIRIPLVGFNSQRNPDAYNNTSKDCRYVNCVVKSAPNPVTRKNEIFLEKRVGLELQATPDGTNTGSATLFQTSDLSRYSSFQTSNSARMFKETTLIGTSDAISGVTSALTQIREISLGGTRYIFFSFCGNANTTQGVYYFDTSVNTATTTFTADTNSNTSLTNVSATTNLRVGQRVTGTDIPSATRITVISGSTVTISNAATGTTPSVTVTQEHASKIMSSNFPTRAAGPIFALNGRIFALDCVNNRIYQSSFNDPQTWAADGYISLDYLPDQSCAIQNNGMTAYGFGQNSIEIFNYQNNPSGSQLTRVGVIDNGVPRMSISPSAVVNGVMYFASFHGGVYKFSDGSPQKISPSSIDALMASAQNQTVSSGSPFIDGFYYNGRPFLHLCGANLASGIATTRFQFWYDIENNVWTEQEFTISSVNRSIRFSSIGELRKTGAIALAALGKTYILDYNSPVYQDDSSTMTMTVQLGRSDLGSGKRKFYNKAYLVGDRQAAGTVTLEYSDDDYGNWITAGTFDLTDLGKPICRLGSSKNGRAWRLTDANNQACRLQALDIEYEIGT